MTAQGETWTRAWAAATTATAPSGAVPATGVIAEVKPHTTRGIRDGIRQLRQRAQAERRAKRNPRGFRYHLVTYRQVDGDPGKYETYISDPRTMEAVVFGTAQPSFLHMGSKPLNFPRAMETIRVHQCPSLLGNELEPRVRLRYAAWMRVAQGHQGFRLASKSASQTGADIRHEMVDFLRELATELEAESYF